MDSSLGSGPVGVIGLDSGLVGAIGQDSRSSGAIGSGPVGAIGLDSGQVGAIGRDSDRVGAIGRDSDWVGAIGWDSDRVGAIVQNSYCVGATDHGSCRVKRAIGRTEAANIPVYTQCQLQNHAGKGRYVTLADHKHWHGYGGPPSAIRDQYPGNFTNVADQKGSIGGVAYLLTDKLKWVVAWSNAEEEHNKVYTRIDPANKATDWAQIKKNLKNSGNQSSHKNKFGYSSNATIHPKRAAPTLTATLRRAQ